jgi:D-tyrosyl-tRNA(Tyr) deacylase
MRSVVQRVSWASVGVAGDVVGAIGTGLLVLVGVQAGDGPEDADVLAAKVVGLRVFPDDQGLMNRSLGDVGGAALVVSQFTLHGDVRKGRRPSFTAAARPEKAEPLVTRVAEAIATAGIPCETGAFGAHMDVELCNDGPVTLVVEVRDGKVV